MFKVTESCRIARIKRQDNQRLTVQIVDIFFETKIVHDLAYIIHSGFISGYQNRYGDNLKPPTNVYHRMTA